MNWNLYVLLHFLMQLGLVVSAPVHQVITNHCDGQDCEINIQYHDNNRDLSLQTSRSDSAISALLNITIPQDDDSDQNNLVSVMENVIVMLSSMMQDQQDNHQQLENIFQQSDMDSQPTPTPDLLGFLQTSSEPDIITSTERVTTRQPTQTPMQDCSSAPSSGQYSISPPNGLNPFLVVCDMDTTRGGWIVIHRRFDGSVDFDRNWVDYENGFGSLDGEFWLGLSKMHTITSHGTWKLRFDLEDFEGNRAYAEYGVFQVGDNASNYQLTIGSYSGTAGDGMIGHNLNGMAFTTKDRDNDNNGGGNCGIIRLGGWWHNYCTLARVTAPYLGEGVTDNNGMSWYYWKNRFEALKKTEMKIKRIN